MAEPKQPKKLAALKGGLNIAKRLFADSDEGAMNAIRSAGRTAHEQEAAIRAAKNAQVKEQMANLPARSKKANESLGLYHPVGGGLKLSKPTSGMHATTVADPKFNPPDIGIITPEQLVKEQAALFPLVGDRAAAGRYLTHVDENELEVPVRLTGGPRYMDANYNPINPDDSAAWESGLGRVTALGRQAERAGQGGRPVYGIYTAGSGTNTDFNIMGANALLQQIPFSKITKKSEREFDRAMKEGTKEFPPIPNWPGIRSTEAQDLILDKSNGIVRTKLFGVMGKENFQSMGFPDVPATRKAIVEPELLDAPTNQAGFRMARMDTSGRIIEDPIIPSDYPAAMAGKVAGKLDVPADYKDIFQSHFDARRLLSQPESGDYYSFSRAHPIQYADDAWLNRLMEKRLADERRIKEGEYKEGGEVDGPSLEDRLTKAIEGHMASGGVVDSMESRLTNAISTHMASGGGAFKKLEFMDKGGKVGKLAQGVASVGKRLLADAPVESPAAKQARLNMMPTARIGVEAPGILIPSKMNNVREAVRNMKGNYGARRVERAADEIPNLEKMYQEDALKEAFTGDNASAMITLSPAEFERYAAELTKRSSVGPKMAELAKQGDIDKMTVPTDEYIQYLQRLQGGFSDVPYLNLFKDEVGLPIKPSVIGHEGRHRSRALSESGAPASLVKINPRGDLREGMPRRTQEDFIEALKEELELSNRLVVPESEPYFRRPDVKFPDVYAEGGAAFKKIQFMDKGGKAKKLVSGIASIGKRLLADAPQADALKLAQERAALPPAKGGLGLPKKNTPEQRAKAMGFDRDTYHGSFRDIKKLDPSSGSTESHAGKGIYSTDSPEDASRNYASIYGPDVSGRVERGLEDLEKDFRKTHSRMRDETLTPRQQEILLRNTVGADNLGVVYPLKIRSNKSIHLDAPESNPVRVGPFEHYDEAADAYVDTPHTAKFNEALDEFRGLGGDANPVYEAVQDYGGAIPARDVFNAVKKTGNESGLYDPFTGDIVSGGVAAGDFMKHFGIDEVRHTPRFMNHELNIGKEHTISFDPDNVRSRFAAFDPFRKSAATAAAMGVAAPDLLAKEKNKDKDKDKKKAEGGGAFKKLSFYDKGGVTTSAGSFSPEELGVTADDLRVMDDKTWERIKKNAPATYDWAKQLVKDEASQLKTARGAKDFALRVGAQTLGGIPDLANLALYGVDTLTGTNLSSENPWFGSQQYLEAMDKAGVLGEHEFPISETVAGFLMPAGLIKKGVKKGVQLYKGKKPEAPKKRRGGLAAMSR
jgi:hypothetical protein